MGHVPQASRELFFDSRMPPHHCRAVMEALEERRLLATTFAAVNDTFDSAGATRADNSNDAQDIPWYLRSSAGASAAVVGDTVLGAAGNQALGFAESGANVSQVLLGTLNGGGTSGTAVPATATLRSAAGSQLQLSFDFAFLGSVAGSASGLRFGLYNETGSRTSGDNSGNSDSDPGYVAWIGTGGAMGVYLGYESGTNGTATAGTDLTSILSGTPTAVTVADTARHTLALTLTRRSDGGIDFSLAKDGTPIAAGTDSSSRVGSFNEIALAFGPISGASVDVDNVKLTVIADPVTSYVANSGNDANSGTSTSAPLKTLAKVQQMMLIPGDQVLLNRGDIWRETLWMPGSGTVSAPLSLGAYGTGANPLLAGGATLTGWTAYTTQATTPEQLLNASIEQFSNDSRNTVPVYWNIFSVDPSVVLKETTHVDAGSTAAVRFTVGSGSILMEQTTALPLQASINYTFSARYASYDNPGMMMDFQLSMNSGADAGKYLQANGTWSTTVYSFTLTGTASYQSFIKSFTPPSSGTVHVRFTRHAGSNGNFLVDNTSLKPASPPPTSPNTYRLAMSSQPGIFTRNRQWFGLGVDPDRLDNNEYLWLGGYLYFRQDSGSPATDVAVYEASSIQADAIRLEAKTDVHISNLSFELYCGMGVNAKNHSDRLVIDSCTATLMGDQLRFGNGVFTLNNSDDGYVQNCTVSNANTDEFYGVQAMRPHFLNNTGSMAFGIAADILQLDYTDASTIPNAGAVVSGNYFDQQGTPSPKGCIISFGGGIYEHNTTRYGQFGISVDGDNSIVRYNDIAFAGIEQNQTYAGGVYTEANGSAVSNVQVYENLLVGCINGLSNTNGTRTGFSYWNNTIFDSVNWGVKFDAFLSGEFKNNLIWAPDTSAGAIYVTNPGTWASDYNLMGPERSGFIRYGANSYSTLAAYKAAVTTKDQHSKSANPLFVDPAASPANLMLQASSPAVNSGTNVGLTQDYTGYPVPSGSAPDIGAYEYQGLFSDLDIGSPGLAGSASYMPSPETYTVKGAGADIWGAADQFNFASMAFTGNAQIVARVTSVQNTNAWAKAGVMFRSGTAADAANIAVLVTPGNSVSLQFRTATGGSSLNSAVAGIVAPVWVKLTRQGDAFTGYYATTATPPQPNDWHQIGFLQTIAMPASTQVGLAVTSHSSGVLSSATFNNVSIVIPPPAVQSVTVNDGNIQRSMVGGITCIFDAPVTVDTGAFSLVRRGDGLSVPVGAVNASGDGLSYLLSFGGPALAYGSLPDGIYDLTLHAAAVRDGLGQTLAGGDQTYTFDRLMGDYNGDGYVDALDSRAFRLAMGSSTGSSGYAAYFDFNADGFIDALDSRAFRTQMGKSLLY